MTLFPEYARRPESLRGVDAIEHTDAATGKRIVDWVEEVRGRGAAFSNNGTLMLPAEEFGGRVVWVPEGWVVYRELLSTDFHIAPKDLFDQMYEKRA